MNPIEMKTHSGQIWHVVVFLLRRGCRGSLDGSEKDVAKLIAESAVRCFDAGCFLTQTSPQSSGE